MANFWEIWREPIIVTVHFPLVWCSFPMESIHQFGMGMTLVPYLVVMACSFHSSVRRVETSLSLALLWDVALSALPPCHPYPSLFFPPLPHLMNGENFSFWAASVYDNRTLFWPDDCSSASSRTFPFCLVLFFYGHRFTDLAWEWLWYLIWL